MDKWKKPRFPRYKEPTGYFMKSSILGSTLQRRIELSFPVYMVGTNITYPAGSATYAGFYSFDQNPTDAAALNAVIFRNILDPSTPVSIGTSREFTDLSKIYTHFKVNSICLDFIRTFLTVGDGYFTLPPLAINMLPDALLNQAWPDDIRSNYFSDNAFYVQPINTVKKVAGRSYELPSRTLMDSRDFAPNDWVPFAGADNCNYAVTIGQYIPIICTLNPGVYEVGNIKVCLVMEFACPVINQNVV